MTFGWFAEQQKQTFKSSIYHLQNSTAEALCLPHYVLPIRKICDQSIVILILLSGKLRGKKHKNFPESP